MYIGSSSTAGSANRFNILAASHEEECEESAGAEKELEAGFGVAEEMQVVGHRKSRAAAAGVAELMKSLKTRKGPIDKGKKQGKAGTVALGSQVSNSLQ